METELSSFVEVEHVKLGESREISGIIMEVGGSDQWPRLTPALGGVTPPAEATALGRLSAWNRSPLLLFLRGALGHWFLRGRGDREVPLQFEAFLASLEGVWVWGGRGRGGHGCAGAVPAPI